MLLYAVKRVACGYWLCLFVCLFFFRTEISKPQFLVFNSKGALWNLRSLTNQPYWWFYCLFHLTLWCKILKNLCSSVKIERPLKHSTQGIMKWKTLTIKVYNVLLVPVILPSIFLSQKKKTFSPQWITSFLVQKQEKVVFCFNLWQKKMKLWFVCSEIPNYFHCVSYRRIT